MVQSKVNCLIIAGEKSGEDHCLSFLLDIKKQLPDCHFWGVGGDSLKDQGVELLFHLKQFSSWGISEVLGKIPFYMKALALIEEEVEKRRCKVAILIDFQTFNLKLAVKLKSKGVKVLYYVAPQAWAWKAWRTKTLEQAVHTLFTIIPFEKKWFMERGVSKVQSVPHPLYVTYRKYLDSGRLGIDAKPFERFAQKIKILLLPGSRNFEVKYHLDIFVRTVRQLAQMKNVETAIVCSPNVDYRHYALSLKQIDQVFSHNDLHLALEWADFALATSGTVTLACALFEVPTLVCYKGSLLNEIIFKLFVRYKGHISLANIVHEQEIFPEFLQRDVREDNLCKQLYRWMNDGKSYHDVKKRLGKTAHKLSGEKFDVADYMSQMIGESYGV